MANTGAFADLSASIKEVYAPGVVEPLVNNELKFRPWLKSALPPGAELGAKGGYATFIADLANDHNVAQAADNDSLPANLDRTDIRLQIKPTAFYGSISVGVLTMNAMNSNTATWNKGELQRQTNARFDQLGKFMESTYTGTHGTGRRARVESDGSNNFVAALPEGVRLLRKGYVLTARTTDGGASVSGSFDNQYITDITRSTRTVTYSGTDRTLTAGDHIHPVTAASQTLTGLYANGLRGLVDDATFATSVHGQSRSSYPDLKSNRYSNGGVVRNLSEQILLNACMDIRDRSGKNITDIWISPGQAQKWAEFVAPDKQVVVSGMDETGNKAMGFRDGDLKFFAPGVNAEVHTSYDIVPREIYLLNRDTFFMYSALEPGWLTPDQMLWLSPATASYKATMLGYICAVENIGINGRFDANGVISDLSDPNAGD